MRKKETQILSKTQNTTTTNSEDLIGFVQSSFGRISQMLLWSYGHGKQRCYDVFPWYMPNNQKLSIYI